MNALGGRRAHIPAKVVTNCMAFHHGTVGKRIAAGLP
jgi:hypothetical protein